MQRYVRRLVLDTQLRLGVYGLNGLSPNQNRPLARSSERLFLCFLVLGMNLTPTAELLELNLASDKFAVLACPIINTATLRTGEFK